MKNVITVMVLFIGSFNCFAQIDIPQATKTAYDVITFDEIKIPVQHPRDILLKNYVIGVGDAPYVDVNGTVYYFSKATWNAIKDDIRTELLSVVNTAKASTQASNKRRINAAAYRAAAKTRQEIIRDKAIQKISDIDGMGNEELP